MKLSDFSPSKEAYFLSWPNPYVMLAAKEIVAGCSSVICLVITVGSGMRAQEECLTVSKSRKITPEVFCTNCEDSFFMSSFLREENSALFTVYVIIKTEMDVANFSR